MARQGVSVDHPLLERLRQLDREAAQRFPTVCDPGLGDVGFILDRELDDSRYPSCTPTNCRTFAHTGGNGVHFSLLVRHGAVRESSPVVVTVPGGFHQNLVAGESLFDFLCLGVHRGFFALEQLGYDPEFTLEVFTNPDWKPTDSWHHSVGYVPRHEERQLLADELGLRPWPSPDRFAVLQERYAGSFRVSAQE
jgi:hypothetical protein